MAVESICLRCLNPAMGWRQETLGFRCVHCWRLMLGDDQVDETILNEHLELIDHVLDRMDTVLDRIFEEAS